MGYDWNKSASGEDSGPRMEPGYYHAKIIKVLRGKKDGTLFMSRNNDPQLMVIWENDCGEECVGMYTLSEKAGFVLAKTCNHVGMNLDKMTEAGVTPLSFEDEDFSRKQLVGRRCWIQVSTYGENGKVSAESCAESDVPVQYINQASTVVGSSPQEQTHEPLAEDDIPF